MNKPKLFFALVLGGAALGVIVGLVIGKTIYTVLSALVGAIGGLIIWYSSSRS
jgi:hypothetical protein